MTQINWHDPPTRCHDSAVMTSRSGVSLTLIAFVTDSTSGFIGSGLPRQRPQQATACVAARSPSRCNPGIFSRTRRPGVPPTIPAPTSLSVRHAGRGEPGDSVSAACPRNAVFRIATVTCCASIAVRLAFPHSWPREVSALLMRSSLRLSRLPC